jgi:hypothetical protein
MGRFIRDWRLLVLVGVVMVVLGGTAVIASGAYPTSGVAVYTGCLTAQGNINNVATSPTTPLHPCGTNQTLVQFSGGTITSVNAGTGLSGGGSDGAVGVSIAPGYQLPQGCAGGQVAKMGEGKGGVGGTWHCADDQNTAYSNGTGLDLSSNSFSVDPSYQLPQGCAGGQVAKMGEGKGGVGGTWECANDQNTTYSGADFATSGQDCPSGQFVTGIDADGNLKCAQFTLPSGTCETGSYVTGFDLNGKITCSCPHGAAVYSYDITAYDDASLQWWPSQQLTATDPNNPACTVTVHSPDDGSGDANPISGESPNDGWRVVGSTGYPSGTSFSVHVDDPYCATSSSTASVVDDFPLCSNSSVIFEVGESTDHATVSAN